MTTDKRDFADYYPGVGKASYAPAQTDALAAVTELSGRVDAMKAAAAAVADPTDADSLGDVKDKLAAVKDAIEAV
jgi:hypothetical protein